MLRTQEHHRADTIALLRMSDALTLRTATDRDKQAIRALLEGCALTTADLTTSHSDFLVACEGSTIVGVGGLQRFDHIGLLRSVAVLADRRGSGLGLTIVQGLEQQARDQGLHELVLLTLTARTFFERQGYRLIERANAPAAVQASEEFRSLCPQSASCMSKRLDA